MYPENPGFAVSFSQETINQSRRKIKELKSRLRFLKLKGREKTAEDRGEQLVSLNASEWAIKVRTDMVQDGFADPNIELS